MKMSNFNFFYDFPEEQKVLAYNSRTSALALMEKENFKSLDNYIENPSASNLDDTLMQDLKRGGFILEDNIDELELLKYGLLSRRYSDKHLGLTIATTLNCNLGCIYCYEKETKKNIKMTKQIQESIINMVASKAKNLDSMDVTWYGGEPLLDMDVIRNLSNEFIQICKENDVKYTASIITNGFKLNRQIAEELREYHVEMAQVTIDGPQQIHDSRRPLIGGQPTFITILNNIKQVSDLIHISLRINTDDTNKEDLNGLLDILESIDLKKKIHVHLGQVRSTNDCYATNNCLTTRDFTNLTYKFDKRANERGFLTNFYNYPTPSGPYCTADSLNSFVIDPEGYVYNCWTEIGDKNCSSSNLVNDNFQGNVDLKLNYMLYDPTVNNKCSSCKILPICMGGCPNLRINNNEDACSEFKYNLERKINDFANFVISQNKREQMI